MNAKLQTLNYLIRRYSQRLIMVCLMSGFITVFGTTSSIHAAVTITPDSIESVVRGHVEAAMELWTEESPKAVIDIDIVNLPKGEQIFNDVDDASEIETIVHSSLERNYSSRALVRVSMKDSTGRQRDLGIPVKLTIKSPVYVLKNNVVAGVPLRRSDFKLEQRDITFDLTHVAGTKFPLEKYEARVNLKAGSVLDTRRVIIPPDVRRNADVQIMLKTSNDVKVAVRGEALSDGRIGQIIRVKHRIGNQRPKYFMGKVISKNKVIVTM